MAQSADDFYAGVTDQTAKLLERAQQYVAMALELGDAAHLEKPDRVIIDLRIKKQTDKDKSNGTGI